MFETAETSQSAIGPYVVVVATESPSYAWIAFSSEALLVNMYAGLGEGEGGGDGDVGGGDAGGDEGGGDGDAARAGAAVLQFLVPHCSSWRKLALTETAFASYSSTPPPAFRAKVISLAGTISMTAPGCNGD
eukprot:scaffold48075_cov48-Phaeocystis_antarctica.AAC.3